MRRGTARCWPIPAGTMQSHVDRSFLRARLSKSSACCSQAQEGSAIAGGECFGPRDSRNGRPGRARSSISWFPDCPNRRRGRRASRATTLWTQVQAVPEATGCRRRKYCNGQFLSQGAAGECRQEPKNQLTIAVARRVRCLPASLLWGARFWHPVAACRFYLSCSPLARRGVRHFLYKFVRSYSSLPWPSWPSVFIRPGGPRSAVGSQAS